MNEIKLQQIFVKRVNHFMRLSCERELYTVAQASFRLNISRNEIQLEYINTGKLKVIFRKGRMFVTDQSIKEFVTESSLVKRNC